MYPAIVGRPKYVPAMVGMGQKDLYKGDEAESMKGMLHLNRPIMRGQVIDWDDMEQLMGHMFYSTTVLFLFFGH